MKGAGVVDRGGSMGTAALSAMCSRLWCDGPDPQMEPAQQALR